ncbi:hypothetical protein FB45DRAFT_964698 [Roridomyces roridus]|uniref:CYTH domain-containing protein n=1 Tax=Roridomyces roridus TaxID=1738132 RepID=A0AAD7AX58_9AGAR|nr:hypothetical protein FB45DRAFT_964698 [Roridomyces roridus]
MSFRSLSSKIIPLVSKIEIERKFLPTLPLLQALTPGSHPSPSLPFRTHPAPEVFIRDVYYDTPDGRLSTRGLWVRRRDSIAAGAAIYSTSNLPMSCWEAKVRVGGDFIASQFVEVEGPEAVERELKRVLCEPHVPVDELEERLGVMCDLTARRLSARVELLADAESARDLRDRNLTLAIDQVVETTGGDFEAAQDVLESPSKHRSADSFFHEIGELEIMAEARTDATEDVTERQDQEHEAVRKAVGATCAAELEAFMHAHPSLFPMTPKPRGKLVAYFAWKESRGSTVC